MNTIEELVHYCKQADPLGALLFTGEWGTGKTHLIDNELSEALAPENVIVRVSLFGVNNINALHDAVRRKWVESCFPIANRIMVKQENINNNSGLKKILDALIRLTNPIVGNTADAISSVNLLDMINIKPVYEDLKTHEKRRAILVFDDMERCNIRMSELLGVVNEYCENQHFHTIVVTNMEYLRLTLKNDLRLFNILKGKTISETVSYQPDFENIIHTIITKRSWRDDEYQNFLLKNEELICDIFASKAEVPESKLRKTHNLLILTSGLQSFYRIHHHLKEAGVQDIESYLSCYIPFHLCHNSGFFKNEQFCFECEDEEIEALYPQFDKEKLFSSLRDWILTGDFDKERFQSELKEHIQKN